MPGTKRHKARCANAAKTRARYTPAGVKSLTLNESRFIAEYVKDPVTASRSLSEIARRAGLSGPTGAHLMQRAVVQEYLAQFIGGAYSRLDVTADKVIQELAAIAFSNIGEFISVDEDGQPTLDLNRVKDNPFAMRIVKKITSETVLQSVARETADDGTQGPEVKTYNRKATIELHDKLGALAQLTKVAEVAGRFRPDPEGPQQTIIFQVVGAPPSREIRLGEGISIVPGKDSI